MSYGKIDKKKFMTLENTVDILVDAVNLHYDVDRVLADFGIKVLGRVNYTSQIPGYIEGPYTGNFGDAYLVSQGANSTAPYDIYIWTRNTPDSVEPDGYWLDIGVLATVGPQGPQGEQGIQGERGESTRWYVQSSNTTPNGSYNEGDMCLLPNGGVYMYTVGTDDRGWVFQTNIKGPQGAPGQNGVTPEIVDGYWVINNQSTGVRAEGRDGANGVPGTAILIRGKTTIDVIESLDPKTEPRNYGYLVTIDDVVYLYYIAGIEGEETWERIEYSGNGTIVTTDGVAQSTWDTNTKLDKTNNTYRIYGTDENGNQTLYYSSKAPGGGDRSVPLRTVYGNIRVPLEPGQGIPTTSEVEECATSKKYVDDLAATKISLSTVPADMDQGTTYMIVTTDKGTTYRAAKASVGASANSFVKRGTTGTIKTATPTEDADAATKKYVDDAIASAGGGDYETAVITKVGDVGSYCRLEMTDLPDIVPGTPVNIYISISFDGIIAAPPPSTFSIGNKELSWTTTQYLGIPFFDNISNQSCATVFNDGTNFVTVKAPATGISFSETLKGTYMDIGIYDGYGGQTTLTVSYIKHS